VLSSLQISGSGDVPMTDLSLKAGAVTMKYWVQNKDGSFAPPEVGGWDVVKNAYVGSPMALAGLAMVMPSAVPEPQTWALGLVALGAVGWARRRQA
jgi:MYXO-CTERM domain-containing protein